MYFGGGYDRAWPYAKSLNYLKSVSLLALTVGIFFFSPVNQSIYCSGFPVAWLVWGNLALSPAYSCTA